MIKITLVSHNDVPHNGIPRTNGSTPRSILRTVAAQALLVLAFLPFLTFGSCTNDELSGFRTESETETAETSLVFDALLTPGGILLNNKPTDAVNRNAAPRSDDTVIGSVDIELLLPGTGNSGAQTEMTQKCRYNVTAAAASAPTNGLEAVRFSPAPERDQPDGYVTQIIVPYLTANTLTGASGGSITLSDSQVRKMVFALRIHGTIYTTLMNNAGSTEAQPTPYAATLRGCLVAEPGTDASGNEATMYHLYRLSTESSSPNSAAPFILRPATAALRVQVIGGFFEPQPVLNPTTGEPYMDANDHYLDAEGGTIINGEDGNPITVDLLAGKFMVTGGSGMGADLFTIPLAIDPTGNSGDDSETDNGAGVSNHPDGLKLFRWGAQKYGYLTKGAAPPLINYANFVPDPWLLYASQFDVTGTPLSDQSFPGTSLLAPRIPKDNRASADDWTKAYSTYQAVAPVSITYNSDISLFKIELKDGITTTDFPTADRYKDKIYKVAIPAKGLTLEAGKAYTYTVRIVGGTQAELVGVSIATPEEDTQLEFEDGNMN